MGRIIKQPATLDEAIQLLMDRLSEELPEIKKETEDAFLGKTHHGLGQWLRNNWYLWWTKKGAERYASWPTEKPAIVSHFNDLGIYHADDMSGIILTSFYRVITGQHTELEKQVKGYQDYWKEKGIDVRKDTE